LVHIQSQYSRVGIEQRLHVGGFTPSSLFPIKQVVHFPKMTLHTGRFGREGSGPRVLMVNERKVMKNYAQVRIEIMLELLDWTGQVTARRTLEVSEFLECNRRVSTSPDVNRFGIILFRGELLRNGENSRALRAIEDRSSRDGSEPDYYNNDKGKKASH
jgi:hypothetical protein